MNELLEEEERKTTVGSTDIPMLYSLWLLGERKL